MKLDSCIMAKSKDDTVFHQPALGASEPEQNAMQPA
jgi:hypothetical protein